jgi:hypothetical protein
MRPQGKPFTVQKKKSRRPRASGQPLFDIVGQKAATSEALPVSETIAAAERAFRQVGGSSASPRAAADPVQSWGLAGAAPMAAEASADRTAAQALTPNRILPDLSRPDPLQGARKDETAMAAKPTRSRIRRKQRREPDAQRGSRTRTRRPPTLDDAGVEPVVVPERLAAKPVERWTQVGAPDPGASTALGKERSGRSRRQQKWSPREIRRAAARGAFKATAGTRGRKRK